MWNALVLGSAQDGGLPQVGAAHPNDRAARTGQLAHRLSSSVAIVADDGRALLLDAGPDLRHHALILTEHHDRRGMPGIVDGVVITHAHMGHYAGLVHFGREASAPDGLHLWATPSFGDFVSKNAPWSLAIDHGHLTMNPVDPGETFTPWDDLTVMLVPVPHRHEASDTVAISVNGRFLYLPDIDSWDEWPASREVIAAHEVAFLDATFHSLDELPGRDIAAIPHPLVTDTVERFGDLTSGTTIVLTHLNHSNPLCDPGSAESTAVRAAGFHVATEGDRHPL